METKLFGLPEKTRASLGRVYFLGIGGSGMYGAACLADLLGIPVCGADGREGKNLARLRAMGVPLFSEDAPLPRDIGTLVYSLAVPKEHER